MQKYDQNNFTGKYDILKVENSVTVDINQRKVQQTKQYLATNLFAKELTDWDILTYKYEMLPNKLENHKMLDEMKEHILHDVRRKIEDLVAEKIAEDGKAPKFELIEKMFNDMVVKRQQEINLNE